MLIFVERGGEADSLAPGKSLDWGTDMLVVSANRNKVIRVTVYLASNENDQFSLEKLGGRLRKVYRANRIALTLRTSSRFLQGRLVVPRSRSAKGCALYLSATASPLITNESGKVVNVSPFYSVREGGV